MSNPLDTLPIKKVRGTQYVQLTLDHFSVISEWYHFAILSLAETQDFKSYPAWIAGRLGISQKDAKAAVLTLKPTYQRKRAK